MQTLAPKIIVAYSVAMLILFTKVSISNTNDNFSSPNILGYGLATQPLKNQESKEPFLISYFL